MMHDKKLERTGGRGGGGGGGGGEREREKIMAFRTTQILHVGAGRL